MPVSDSASMRPNAGGERRDGGLAAAGHDTVGVAVADQPLGHAAACAPAAQADTVPKD